MLPVPNTYTTICVLISWFCSLCYGFVLLSSAAGAGGVPEANILEPGGAWRYQLHTTVLLNEKGESSNDVGFMISGDVVVQSVWGNSNHERLLRFELRSPQLYIRSRKAPAPDGFVLHSSNLDSLQQTSPFFVEWSRGRVKKIHLQKDEEVSLANMKKGLASLFQFQLLDQETNETDSSGHCQVIYERVDLKSFKKSKKDCVSPDFTYISNPQLILGTHVESTRTVTYELDNENKYVNFVASHELHSMYLNAKEEIGNKVDALQTLQFKEKTIGEVVSGSSFDDAMEKMSNKEGIIYTQESLQTELESVAVEDGKLFVNAVDECRNNLKSNLLGTLSPAKVFAKLVTAARKANKEDIAKALGAKKNKDVLHQMYDVLGYAQTMDAHDAVMKKLHFDQQKHEELSERYLWALSTATNPNPEIINDLLNRHKKAVGIPDKVKETLLLTIAAMANKLSKISKNHKVINNVEEAILQGLEHSKGDERIWYLRALKSLQSESAIPYLIKTIKKGTLKEGVFAWKALKALESSAWTKNIIDLAYKTFFQLDKMHDSSSRTIAVDILLESKPTDEILKDLIYFLVSNDKAFEVKQYLLQTMNMIGGKDRSFRSKIDSIIKNDNLLNNYGVLAQKGLSTALTRTFMNNPSSNGSLVTIQEMFGGIAKRGVVNVVLEKNDVTQELFSLGIFSGGLSSFLSSDNEGTESDETATAGMELTVLGNQIRPFVFFTGQGELMGHVWSGTASEKTTAYQALAMLQDHLQYLRLGPGFIAELDLKGSLSFDLSGKIEFSLWNRNAVSLVEKSAGIAIIGLIRVDTSFVKSRVEFSLSLEPKLNLQTDIDFYSGVSLCMRLAQPDSVVRHNVYKIERITESKHRLRKVKYKKFIVPGKTYSLNQKNNDMCNVIFK